MSTDIGNDEGVEVWRRIRRPLLDVSEIRFKGDQVH
jgi:hypothetical protein